MGRRAWGESGVNRGPRVAYLLRPSVFPCCFPTHSFSHRATFFFLPDFPCRPVSFIPSRFPSTFFYPFSLIILFSTRFSFSPSIVFFFRTMTYFVYFPPTFLFFFSHPFFFFFHPISRSCTYPSIPSIPPL